MPNDKMQQPKILVVDDNEMVRTSMSEVLDFNQFQVKTAASVA
jgi:CheY-like chemotaxis protein